MATNDSYLPAEYNTGIVRGDYFQETFTFTVDGESIDLTDCDARIQVKDLSNRVQFPVNLSEFIIEPDPTVITGIKIIDENSLRWNISDSDTKTFPPGTYQYDIELTIGGKVRTYVRGQFNVERDITV
mgnify:CR=1 FL=1